METVRNIIFEKNVHIITDFKKAKLDYFKNPKYKTPDNVLLKKKKKYVCLITAALQKDFYYKGV